MRMRETSALWVLAIVGLLGCGGGTTTDGSGGARTTSSTTTSGTGGTGGDDGGPPPGCIPSENVNAVADTCGAFVSPTGNDTTGKGTKDAPFRSFKKALEKADTIYACAGAMPFVEAVTLDKPVTLFGALDCVSWEYDANKKTKLTANADEVPLTLSSAASGSEVIDFAVTSADAMQAGGSSIAVMVDGADASFTRVDVVAGNGKDGEAGATPSDPVGPTDPNDTTIKGNDGKAACADPADQTGGGSKENMLCPAASGGPIGGKGGSADTLSGSNGDVNPATAKTALGGSGQPSDDMGAWSCVPGVGLGGFGTPGGTGTAGTGAQSTDLGSLSNTGYKGVAGLPGGPGLPGQGGGGGGGAKGKTMCAGASGGGGGAGGCGGHGGTGGKAGGASIGVVSLGAKLIFEAVTINAGAGGKGGDGGPGQKGGTGGNGGNGGIGASDTSDACNGGKGGQGGFGGKGGGGRGGHAIGIAHTGTAPMTKGVTFTEGTPGEGGQGDNNNGNMGDGAKGVATNVLAF